MAPKIFGRLASPRTSRSFYEELRNGCDDPDLEEQIGLNVDEENFRHNFNDYDADELNTADSRLTVDSAPYVTKPRDPRGRTAQARPSEGSSSRWLHDEEIDNDVPASLLVEPNTTTAKNHETSQRGPRRSALPQQQTISPPAARARAQWDVATAQQRLHAEDTNQQSSERPRPLMSGARSGGPREKALWRWANVTNLDSFMRDVYDYFEGGGLRCILCSNALRLLETLFVAIFLTFLSQCIDYSKLPGSKSLNHILISQCTRKMSTFWNIGIWLYSFFFIWKLVQYFFEIRRLVHIRNFYVYLLDIPEQDMQTVSWQDIVARIMALRDQNPKTAANLPLNVRRFIGSQSKERLDAHDIANRLMRKENYLIAMINKDILDLSLSFPFIGKRQIFSRTTEWYLHYAILDMAFNELGQVQQDFLRADRRGLLSQKLRQRLIFAGILHLMFAPVALAYVVIVYFLTYYNEYNKDPKRAAARKYTALAEWKFREFNELPHIFYERLHMSFPFATRYLDQFPKRTTEDVARTLAFISGAIMTVLAIATVLDSELLVSFEITKDRPVLFYVGVFGAIWAMAQGMISEDTAVFNPEYALLNVVEYTRFMPDHWEGRLHSFEVKQEFSELYKMKVIIFLEEVMGIVTTPLLLLFALPKCSDQIIDFFREFTIHVDGLGYVCSFAVFDFKKGANKPGQQQGTGHDVREDYYSTKHGKMAASYYGFIDNYVVNPKTGIPGHMPPATRQHFYPPPAFPGLGSPTLGADVHNSQMGPGRTETGRARSRVSGGGPSKTPRFGPNLAQPSPMASLLLDPHHQPTSGLPLAKSLHRSRHPRIGYRGDGQIIEESFEARNLAEEEDTCEEGGILGESTWETSPGKRLSRENSAATTKEPETGVLGLIYQLQQTQPNRRGGVV